LIIQFIIVKLVILDEDDCHVSIHVLSLNDVSLQTENLKIHREMRHLNRRFETSHCVLFCRAAKLKGIFSLCDC